MEQIMGSVATGIGNDVAHFFWFGFVSQQHDSCADDEGACRSGSASRAALSNRGQRALVVTFRDKRLGSK